MKGIGVVFLTILLSCGRSKNIDFNPFDNEFKLHRNFSLINADTVLAGCGYWNLREIDGSLETYYQFYGDEKPILAKGFILNLPDIVYFSQDSLESEEYMLNLQKSNPIDFEFIKQELSGFKIKDVQVSEPPSAYTKIVLIDHNDSIYQAEVITNYEEGKIIRSLNYFNPRGNLSQKY